MNQFYFLDSFSARFIRSFYYKAPITDEELFVLSKNLHINDVNEAIVKLDLQTKTTIGDTLDKAPSR
jgi:hypothetical protein